jgi:hypothetical protein
MRVRMLSRIRRSPDPSCLFADEVPRIREKEINLPQ